jgi:hypothetical protein
LLNTTLPTDDNFNAGIIIDGIAPTTRPTAATYNPTTNKITVSAATTNYTFANIAASASDDMKAFFDWSKIFWGMNEDQTSVPVYFNDSSSVTAFDSAKITSALITNDTTLEITLNTTYANNTFEAHASFGNLGGTGFAAGTEGLKISEGFIKDKAGNVADVDASSSVDTTNDYVMFSKADAFSASNAGSIDLSYAGTNTAPDVTGFTAVAATGTDGSDTMYIVGDKLTLTATVDKKVTKDSKFTAVLDVTDSSATASDPTITFKAAADGTTLVAEHTITAGENITALKIASFTQGTTTLDSQYTSSGLLNSTLPTDDNFDAGITIDGIASGVTVSTVEYSPSTDTLTLKGSNFNTIQAASSSADIKAHLGKNSKKIIWDVNTASSGSSDLVNITTSDLLSAKVPNSESMVLVLTTSKANAIETTTNYALATTDQVTIETGFFSDVNGNTGAESAVSKNITFTDTQGPTITSVTTTTSAGTYSSSDAAIPISVTFNEPLKSNSTMNITMNTTKTITLGTVNGSVLSGTYTIGSTDKVNGLDIQDIVDASVSVQDLYGNVMLANTAVPDAKNLTASKAINLSNLDTADVVVDASPTGQFTVGDLLVFRFNDTVINKSAINTELQSEGFGTTGASTAFTASWNASDDLLNVTLGSDESLTKSGSSISVSLDVQLTGEGSTTATTYTFDI